MQDERLWRNTMEIGRATNIMGTIAMNIMGTIAMILLFLWTIAELLSIYVH